MEVIVAPCRENLLEREGGAKLLKCEINIGDNREINEGACQADMVAIDRKNGSQFRRVLLLWRWRATNLSCNSNIAMILMTACNACRAASSSALLKSKPYENRNGSLKLSASIMSKYSYWVKEMNIYRRRCMTREKLTVREKKVLWELCPMAMRQKPAGMIVNYIYNNY